MPPQPFATHSLCAARPSPKKVKLHHKIEDLLIAHLGLDLCRRDVQKRCQGEDARILSDHPTTLYTEHPTRVALFAHYNPQHRVSEMVLAYLEQLHRQGFSIHFISITPVLHEDDIAALHSRVAQITIRREFGRDIGAWRDIWYREAHRYAQAEEILLANDSVLGPLCDLAPIVRAMRTVPKGLVGLIDTPLIEPHLQSYFLLVRGREGLQTLAAFFDQLLITDKKTRLIRRGELGITRFFQSQNLPVRSVFCYDLIEETLLAQPKHTCEILSHMPELVPDGLAQFHAGQQVDATRKLCDTLRQTSHNPSLAYWQVLIEDMGFPFLKTELLRLANAKKIPLGHWRQAVEHQNPEMLHHILAHLEQMNVYDETLS